MVQVGFQNSHKNIGEEYKDIVAYQPGHVKPLVMQSVNVAGRDGNAINRGAGAVNLAPTKPGGCKELLAILSDACHNQRCWPLSRPIAVL